MEDLGENLRSLRLKQNKSQRSVAKAAGVSNGTISLIENGKIDPTVGQFRKILEALHTTVAEFFETSGKTKERYFFNKDDLVEIGSGKISFLQIAHPNKDRKLQIISETFEVGADTGPSMLSHDGEEGGFILSGEIEIQVLDQRRILKAGDAYQFPSKLPHRFRNIGSTPCRIITACTPPSF